VLRQATIDIRDEYKGNNSDKEKEDKITSEEIRQEVAEDLTKITDKKTTVKKKRRKRRKKTRKK